MTNYACTQLFPVPHGLLSITDTSQRTPVGGALEMLSTDEVAWIIPGIIGPNSTEPLAHLEPHQQ